MGAEMLPEVGSGNAVIEGLSKVPDPVPYSNGVLHEREPSCQLPNGVTKGDTISVGNGSMKMEQHIDDQEALLEAAAPQATDVSVSSEIEKPIPVLFSSNGNEAANLFSVGEGSLGATSQQIGAGAEENGSGWSTDMQLAQGDSSGWLSAEGALPANASASVTEQAWPSARRRTYYLAKIPRSVDNKIKNEIRLAEMRLEETNKRRDFFRAALQLKRASKTELLEKLKPIRDKERACRDAMQGKRMQMEPFQSALFKFRNAHGTVRERGQDLCSSEEELNDRIAYLQYRIQHESIPLKEEKQLVREIKQLEATRNQVCANSVLQAELVENLGCNREDIQDQCKLLGQDLDDLRKEHKQARADYEAIDKEVEVLNAAIEELRQQMEKSNRAQQEAYVAFRELKKQENAKNDRFYQNKRDIQSAKELVLQKNSEALEIFCHNQVEGIFALWNNDAEFRTEYMKSNERSTLKRLETLDGRSLGPDEEPPLLLSEVDVFTGALSKSTDNSSVVGVQATTLGGGRTNSSKLPSEEVKVPGKVANATPKETSNEVNTLLDSKKSEDTDAGQTGLSKSSVSSFAAGKPKSGQNDSLEDTLDKKAEAAELKERRRQEEMAKAKEAAERKRRQAEKAEAKALVRARKEAERKEKEREKRARRKVSANATVASDRNPTEVDSQLETAEAVTVPEDFSTNPVNEVQEVPRGLPSQRRRPSGKKPKTSKPAMTNTLLKKGTWPIPLWALVVLTLVVLFAILAVWMRF